MQTLQKRCPCRNTARLLPTGLLLTGLLLKLFFVTCFVLTVSGSTASAATQLDISSYGAKCNGSDDRGAVQAAFNALPDGGTLNFSCQAYVSSPGVQLTNKTGVTVTATNNGGIKALGTSLASAWNLFQITNCTSCTIENLQIDSSSLPAIGLHINSSNNTTIQGNTVQHVVWPAACALCTINSYGNHNNKYLHNTIMHTGQGPAGTFNGTRGMWIGQNNDYLEYSPDIEYNYCSDNGHTCFVAIADAPIVRHNTAENLNTNGAGCGIKVCTDPGQSQAPNYIEYNTVRDAVPGANDCGIQIEAVEGNTTTPIYIRYNTMQNLTGSGLYLGEPSYTEDNLYVVDNDLIDTGLVHPYAMTIYGKYGTSGGSKLMIQNNRITRDTASGEASGPLMLDGVDGGIGTSGVVISGNTFTNGTSDGVRFLGGTQPISDVTISQNNFVHNTNHGVAIDSSSNITGVTITPDNCYTGNGISAVIDGRGILSSPAQSASCGSGTTTTTTTFSPIRINAGGPAYTDSTGNAWTSDTSGDTYQVAQPISNTSAQALYQSERYGSTGTLDYTFSVPNDSYKLTLKFAEVYWTNPGQRIFGVWINGQQVLTNFDIVSMAGGAFRAIDETFPVNVTNGQIAIHMVSTVDYPKLSALQILKATTPATDIRIRAGASAYTDPTGNTWAADTTYNQAGSLYSTTAAISNTTAPVLYQTERFNPNAMNYTIPITNGTYNVTLKFAEIYFTQTGKRVFNATINGQQVLTNFDIVAAAGGANKAIDRTFPVTVTNGQISIQFAAVVENPKISAIEITN